MHTEPVPISSLIAAEITDRNTTQVAAAAELGVSQSVVSRWVNGKDTPADEHVSALMDFLGLSRDEVLAAIYQQRVERSTLAARVGMLEAELAGLRADLQRLLESLTEPGS